MRFNSRAKCIFLDYLFFNRAAMDFGDLPFRFQ